MDITTRKFTITLPTLIGILSAISTIIGGYWYFIWHYHIIKM